MAAPGLVNLSGLMDGAKCFAFVRQPCGGLGRVRRHAAGSAAVSVHDPYVPVSTT